MGFIAKELELTQYGVSVVKSGTNRDVQGSEMEGGGQGIKETLLL